MYGLTVIAYGYEQIRGIYKICTLCGKFTNNFLSKLQSLKTRLKAEVTITEKEQKKIDRQKAKYDFN